MTWRPSLNAQCSRCGKGGGWEKGEGFQLFSFVVFPLHLSTDKREREREREIYMLKCELRIFKAKKLCPCFELRSFADHFRKNWTFRIAFLSTVCNLGALQKARLKKIDFSGGFFGWFWGAPAVWPMKFSKITNIYKPLVNVLVFKMPLVCALLIQCRFQSFVR